MLELCLEVVALFGPEDDVSLGVCGSSDNCARKVMIQSC
jgi:hypothetical protein